MTTTVRKGTNRPAAAAKRIRAAQKTTRKPVTTATLPEDFPGAKKVARLLDGASEHGWTVALSDLDPKTGAATVTVSKGEDSIRNEFIDGKSAGYAFHTLPDGKVRKLNNVSAVLHVMAGLTPSGHPLPAPTAPAPAEDSTPAVTPALTPRRTRSRRAE
ncbi:MAG TPA: hypothetical protein VF483_07715 [Gemmatimonadaceae bacterium]